MGLGEAVGKAIISHLSGKHETPPENFPFSRYKFTDEKSWERKTRMTMGLGDELLAATEETSPTKSNNYSNTDTPVQNQLL